MNDKINVFFVVLICATIFGCNDDKVTIERNKLTSEIVESMVIVEGGRFQMGDFGPLIGEMLPFTPDADNKPLHWVELTDFKISKNKVTWKEFNLWLHLTNRNSNDYYKWATKDGMAARFKVPTGDNYPAVANWNDAYNFCQWIGHITKKKISLPTEAQWEFSARSRGQFLQFANSDNIYDLRVPDDKLNFTHDHTPIGSFLPNPLGLYDMMGNGHDWVIDWYEENYYEHSPGIDPQGPMSGNEKVIRGYLGSMFGLYDITRGSNKPETEGPGYGFRCVENK
ncbi:TPA: hypothetical protein JD264_11275 [Serratia fonticola]|nr:hypothetical protein [Serratia fonticola]